MVGVPNIANMPGVSLASVFRMVIIIPKINAQASMSISYPPYFELAISRTKRGGIDRNCNQSYLSNFIGVISTSASRMPTC